MKNKFPNVTQKSRRVYLQYPQIRELMQDKQFDEELNETERKAWLSFLQELQGLSRKSQISKLSECCAVPRQVDLKYVGRLLLDTEVGRT